jgi:Sigma-70 region 2
MDEHTSLAESFDERRDRLRAVAYRVLGSLTEADDAVQETWLRPSGTGHDEVDDLGAWLTTVVTRVSLNMLRSRKTRSEIRVPDPIIDRSDGTNPEHPALLANGVGLALMVVLETLVPADRPAKLLQTLLLGAESARHPDARSVRDKGHVRFDGAHSRRESRLAFQADRSGRRDSPSALREVQTRRRCRRLRAFENRL